jgi:uncharacterized protein (TIGR02145 family)
MIIIKPMPQENICGKNYNVGMMPDGKVWMLENLAYAGAGREHLANRYYNWNEAMTLCPPGWHLPNKTEWENLNRLMGSFQNVQVCEFLAPESFNASLIGGFIKRPENIHSGEEDDIEIQKIGEEAWFWGSDCFGGHFASTFFINQVETDSKRPQFQYAYISVRYVKNE